MRYRGEVEEMELVELVKMLDMEGGSGWKNGKLNGI